jgi:hypothetical protein
VGRQILADNRQIGQIMFAVETNPVNHESKILLTGYETMII